MLILILMLNSAVTFAQTEGARVAGRVTDESDALIPGAQCTITNIENNVSTTATTNRDRIYVIPYLPPPPTG